MPIWFQILTGVFAIANIVCSIVVILVKVIYNCKKNKINTKNLSVSFTLEQISVPKALESHPCEAYNCFIFCTNNTNKKLAIHKIELITIKNQIVEISNHKHAPIAFFIEPKIGRASCRERVFGLV